MNPESRSDREARRTRDSSLRLIPSSVCFHTKYKLFPLTRSLISSSNGLLKKLEKRKKIGCNNKKLKRDGSVRPEITRRGEFASCWIWTRAAESRLVFNPLWPAGEIKSPEGRTSSTSFQNHCEVDSAARAGNASPLRRMALRRSAADGGG